MRTRPVEYNPFPRTRPVDHDPFAPPAPSIKVVPVPVDKASYDRLIEAIDGLRESYTKNSKMVETAVKSLLQPRKVVRDRDERISGIE